MSKKGAGKTNESIRPYLARLCKVSTSNAETERPNTSPEKSVTGKMATVEQVEAIVNKLGDKLGDKLSEKFSQLELNFNKKFEELSNKFDSIEMDVAGVKQDITKVSDETEKLKDEVTELKRQVLTHQMYGRKYNLLLYGVEGHETSPVETTKVVRRFARNSLKLSADTADNLHIRNAHRLRKPPGEDRPAAIIVVFLYWHERQQFLDAGKNLRGTRMSVRTDLPLPLKIERSKLATVAYKLRQEQALQTRIRERAPDVWLETRRSTTDSWKKWEDNEL